VLTRYFEPAFRGGGPIQTIGALVRARPSWTSTAIICGNSDHGDPTPLVDMADQWIHQDGVDVWYARPTLGAAITAFIRARYPKPRIVYLNSLFDPIYSIIPQILSACGLWGRAGLVVAPRGQLDPGALAIKALKKRVFLAGYRLLGCHRRVLWHASTPLEAENVRRVFGESIQIAVRENETSLPVKAQQRGPRPPGPCRLVYASRVVPKKGLLTALEALTKLVDPVDFDVIGAFEDRNYEAACGHIITRLPTNVRLRLHGALPRSALLEKLRGADIMLFPTAGENFGHVIAEALSESCPLMCSNATPWTERLAGGAGGIVRPNTPDAWAAAIKDLVAAGPGEWQRHSDKAATAFDNWRAEDKGEHIFALAHDHFGLTTRPSPE